VQNSANAKNRNKSDPRFAFGLIWIRPKIVDALSRRSQSFRQVWYKSAVDCMRTEKTEKC